MISDTMNVTLRDGSVRRAMEIYPGKEVYTPSKALNKLVVKNRTIEERSDTICLVLSNGRNFWGSRDQKVSCMGKRYPSFITLSDVEIGMTLRGDENGVRTLVKVVGVQLFAKTAHRLIGFDLAGAPFVVEGVVCKS